MTVSDVSSVPGGRWSTRATATLVLTTVGLGLNLRAWILLGPQLYGRFDLRLTELALLIGLPPLFTVLLRLPVGVLTDRYGARVMFPVVSLASAVSVFGLGMAASLPAAAVAGAGTGAAGTAFVVGAALLSRTVPYGRRGLALGVFGLGPAVAVTISVLSRVFDPGGRRSTLVLGGLLVAFAGLTALALRDHVPGRPDGSPLRRCVEMVRLASRSSLTLLYALALGGVVTIATYMPLYLTLVLDMAWLPTLAITGGVVALATLARLFGGWWTDRRPSARLLLVCFSLAACLCLLAAVPLPGRLTVAVVAAIAVCYGTASGALLALIGKAARPGSAGTLMGVTGTAAAFGPLPLVLVLVGVNRIDRSGSVAWILLAIALLVATRYVRASGLRVSLGLAMRPEPQPGPTAMTVAVVDGSGARWGVAAVVASLADLAASDELVVVVGSDEPERSRLSGNVVVNGLRDRLPRYEVVGLRTAVYDAEHDRFAAIIDGLVEAGVVAVAVTPTANVHRVAARLSSQLRADRVLKLSYTLADGASLHQVWSRLPLGRVS